MMTSPLYGSTAAACAGFLCAAVLAVSSEQERVGVDLAPLMRRNAEAHLELAEVQLEIRLDANKRAPNAFTAKEIDRSRGHVEVAREQLRLAMMASDGDAADLHVSYAQSEANVTGGIYQRALKATEADPSAFSQLKLRELRLEAEVAQLRLAIWSNPGTSTLSIIDHMHWQIEQISEEVVDLQERVGRLSE